MIAERIKYLREKNGITQSELGRILGITRSSVNAWELGISVPSTHYIIEIASYFKVSSDYLLGLNTTSTAPTDGLSEDDIKIILSLIDHLRRKNKESLN